MWRQSRLRPPDLGLSQKLIVTARSSPDDLFIELDLHSIHQLSCPPLVFWHLGVAAQPTTEVGLKSDNVPCSPQFLALFVGKAGQSLIGTNRADASRLLGAD